MDSKNRHILWIDFARAAAILMVVLCHAVEGIYWMSHEYINTIRLFSKLFAFSCFTLGRIGVPFFLMMTGYLLLDRDYDVAGIQHFWKAKWLNLLFCTWIWILIYEVCLVMKYRARIGFLQILEDLLFIHRVSMPHLWYLTMILGVYILIPFVAYVLKRFDSRIFVFPLIIFTVYAFGFPTIQAASAVLDTGPALENQFSLGFTGGVYGLYLIIGFFLKKGMMKRVKSRVICVIMVSFFALAVAFQIWAYSKEVDYKIWYDNILILAASVSAFELISRMRIKDGYSLIHTISKYSFGIYLIHVLVRVVFVSFVKSLPVGEPAQVLLLWIITSAASYAVAVIISRIPKIGKYILYIK